jgi:uncharacterized protein (TIRG00374 family)
MMIGYLANNLLPARTGELARIYVFSRRTRVSKSAAAATVILERLIDALFLLGVAGIVSSFISLPDVVRRGALAVSAILLSAAVTLVLITVWRHRMAGWIVERGFFGGTLGRRLGGMLGRFAVGLGVLRNVRQGTLVLALTLLVWTLESLSVTFVLRSLSLDLPWTAALFVLIVISLSSILPTAPGAVGTYEFFSVAALKPFAVPDHQAVGLAVVLHATSLVLSTTMGLICLWSESMSWRELGGRDRSHQGGEA